MPNDNLDTVRCHACGGNGRANAIGSFNPRQPLQAKRLSCLVCGGSGRLSVTEHERRLIGTRYRSLRTQRGETGITCARRLGVEVSALAAMEQGRADVAPLQQDMGG